MVPCDTLLGVTYLPVCHSLSYLGPFHPPQMNWNWGADKLEESDQKNETCCRQECSYVWLRWGTSESLDIRNCSAHTSYNPLGHCLSTLIVTKKCPSKTCTSVLPYKPVPPPDIVTLSCSPVEAFFRWKWYFMQVAYDLLFSGGLFCSIYLNYMISVYEHVHLFAGTHRGHRC